MALHPTFDVICDASAPRHSCLDGNDCSYSSSFATKSKTTQLTGFSTREPSQPIKQVAFNGHVMVRNILHFNNYTDEEVEACWFDEQQFKVIRKNALFDANLAQDGHLDEDDEKHCRRGVEMYTGSKEAKRRRQRKMTIRWAVLEEMALQLHEGLYDEEYIAELYGNGSSCCSAAALEIALEDELNAIPL